MQFDQPVSGFGDSTSDVTIGGTATVGTPSITGVDADTYTVTVPATGEGTITVSVPATSAVNANNQPNVASNTATVTYDTTGPVATVNLGTGQTTPASITPVVFAVSFDEDVTGFDGTDIVVGGSAGATTGVVNGTGADYTVTIDTVPNAGTVTLDVNAGAVTDAPGNASTTTIVANTVTFQTVPDAPTNASAGAGNQSATVSWTAPANTGGTLITGYRIEQSTNGTDWTPATTSTDTTTSTATTTTATGLTNNTAVQFRIAAINTIGTSTPSTPTTAVTPTTAPTVAVNPPTDATNTSPASFTVQFDQPVSGFGDSTSDVTIGGTATVGTPSITGVDADTYTVTVPATGEGTITVSVPATSAVNANNQPNVASNTATVTYDTTGPVATVNLGTGQTTPASITPVVFAVSFDEDVTGFDGTDIVVGGSAGATTGVVNGTGADYTVTIDTVPNAGTVTLDVNAGAVTDAPGNASTTTIVANTVTFQTVPDAPTNASAGAGNQSATVSWTAPANTGGTLITGYRIEQSTNGTDWTPATTSTDTTTSTATTTTATGLTNNTAVQFRIAAINTIGTSTPSTPTTAVTPTTAPTVAIFASSGQNDPTNTTPITFTATFDQPVTGLDTTDIAIAGTATGATATVTGGPSTYTITIDAMTSDGTIAVTVPAGAATNANTQPNTASNTATVTYDTTAPTINTPTGGIQATTDPGQPGATVTYNATASDPEPTAPPTQQPDTLTATALREAPTLVCTPASGSFFPIGATTVTCTATDTAGNTTTTSFGITVADNEAPIISGANQSFDLAPGASNSTFAYVTPTATDNSGTATITCTPSSGATFTAGTTTITCTATDPSNNTTTANYTITANAVPAPTTPAPPATTPPAPTAPPATAPPATTQPATTQPTIPGGGLPATGSNPNNLLTLALGLLTLGALTIATTRRRRTLR